SEKTHATHAPEQHSDKPHEGPATHGSTKHAPRSNGSHVTPATHTTSKHTGATHGVSKTTVEGKRTKRPAGCDASNEPCEIDCEHEHKISSEENKLVGVLSVKKCSSKEFEKHIAGSKAVAKELSSLVDQELTKKGIKVAVKIDVVKVVGDDSHCEFHYSVDAKKEEHEHIKAALHTVCKEKQLRVAIDEHQRRSCNDDSSSSDSSSGDDSKDVDEKIRRPHKKSKSHPSDLSSSSSSEENENKPKPTRKTEVAKHRTGHIVRILSTSADVPFRKGSRKDTSCARCALRKISSTLLLEGVSLEQVSSRLCGRFPQNFKYILAAGIRKFQRVGL
ncbi:unnamed protein product, partial [Adineta steineri]